MNAQRYASRASNVAVPIGVCGGAPTIALTSLIMCDWSAKARDAALPRRSWRYGQAQSRAAICGLRACLNSRATPFFGM
jgi:hypothetical protein